MSNTRRVEIYQIADVVNSMVDEWTAAVVAGIDTAQTQTITEARKYIKPDTPSYNVDPDSKPYINLYTMRTQRRRHSKSLWNSKYQLSHLLEDGHEVYNQYGGPYSIKKRVEDTSQNHNRTIPDNMTTSRYDMWDDTFDDFDVEQVYIDYIKKNLEEIRTK